MKNKLNWERHTLIKCLDDIDHKLKNITYIEQETFVGELSGNIMNYPPITRMKYSAEELTALFTRKFDIITELHKLGVIDKEGYVRYLLSEGSIFTPKLCFY